MSKPLQINDDRLVLLTLEVEKSLTRLLDHYEQTAWREYQQCDDYENHIYLPLLVVRTWLDDQ